ASSDSVLRQEYRIRRRVAKHGDGAATSGIEESDQDGYREGPVRARSRCRPFLGIAPRPDHLLACFSEADLGGTKRLGGKRCRRVLESLWSAKGSVEGELAISPRGEERRLSVRPRPRRWRRSRFLRSRRP